MQEHQDRKLLAAVSRVHDLARKHLDHPAVVGGIPVEWHGDRMVRDAHAADGVLVRHDAVLLQSPGRPDASTSVTVGGAALAIRPGFSSLSRHPLGWRYLRTRFTCSLRRRTHIRRYRQITSHGERMWPSPPSPTTTGSPRPHGRHSAGRRPAATPGQGVPTHSSSPSVKRWCFQIGTSAFSVSMRSPSRWRTGPSRWC